MKDRILNVVSTVWNNPIAKIIIFIIAVAVPFGVTVLGILNAKNIKKKLSKEETD